MPPTNHPYSKFRMDDPRIQKSHGSINGCELEEGLLVNVTYERGFNNLLRKPRKHWASLKLATGLKINEQCKELQNFGYFDLI